MHYVIRNSIHIRCQWKIGKLQTETDGKRWEKSANGGNVIRRISSRPRNAKVQFLLEIPKTKQKLYSTMTIFPIRDSILPLFACFMNKIDYFMLRKSNVINCRNGSINSNSLINHLEPPLYSILAYCLLKYFWKKMIHFLNVVVYVVVFVALVL